MIDLGSLVRKVLNPVEEGLLMDGKSKAQVIVFESLKPGEYVIPIIFRSGSGNKTKFVRYTDRLRKAGLDIYRSNGQFGWETIYPENNGGIAKLIIYRIS